MAAHVNIVMYRGDGQLFYMCIGGFLQSECSTDVNTLLFKFEWSALQCSSIDHQT